MANHKAIVEYESLRHYKHRNYVLGKLDQRYFDELNAEVHVFGLCGYCLDAMDDLPTGSMAASASLPAISSMPRGLCLADHRDQQAFADRLVDELLAEEGDSDLVVTMDSPV
jgi:hypothetical protein